MLLSAIASPEPCDGEKSLGAFWRDGRAEALAHLAAGCGHLFG
jgi:hypothetical protein